MTELQIESLAIAVFCGILFLLFLTPQFASFTMREMPVSSHRIIAVVLLFTAIVYMVNGLIKGCLTCNKDRE